MLLHDTKDKLEGRAPRAILRRPYRPGAGNVCILNPFSHLWGMRTMLENVLNGWMDGCNRKPSGVERIDHRLGATCHNASTWILN